MEAGRLAPRLRKGGRWVTECLLGFEVDASAAPAALVEARVAKLDGVLRRVLHVYPHKDRLREDVVSLFKICHVLHPQAATFVGSGTQLTLFCLHGVLPVTCKNDGSTHRVPVTMYVDPPYPHQAPRCFVTPPPDMVVRSRHPHVDANGMVRIPYLRQWRQHASSLAGLLGGLTLAFSAAPPLCPPGGDGCGPSELADSLGALRESRTSDVLANNFCGVRSPGTSFKSAMSEPESMMLRVE